MQSSFWQWLDIKQLTEPPISDPRWIPDRHLWWWRASRVVRDVNLAGADIEVIDEFPFFSFLLADNHPHLLSIPYALMSVAFALQIFLRGGGGETRLTQTSLSRNRLVRDRLGGRRDRSLRNLAAGHPGSDGCRRIVGLRGCPARFS